MKQAAIKSIPLGLGHCNQTLYCNTASVLVRNACGKPDAFLGSGRLSFFFLLLASNTALPWATGGLWLIWPTYWITVNSCNLTISSKYVFALIIQTPSSKDNWKSMWILVEKEHLGHIQKMENKGAACASEVTGSPGALRSRSSCWSDESDALSNSASVQC